MSEDPFASSYANPPVPFIRHDPDGRITGSGSMETVYIAAEAEAQGGILVGQGAKETHYVDLSGGARLRKRRLFVPQFDTLGPTPGEAATIDVPAPCLVTVTGPVEHRMRHPGGPLSIGFAVPGTYTVRIDAAPYRPAEFTLTVPVTP